MDCHLNFSLLLKYSKILAQSIKTALDSVLWRKALWPAIVPNVSQWEWKHCINIIAKFIKIMSSTFL